MMNIPNLLTLLRIVFIPVLVLAFYLPVSWAGVISATIFTLAAITDWLDGYLARKWKQVSAFGAFLDPVADKLIVAVALVLLVERHANLWMTLPAVVIIGREIAVSALREWMAETGKRAHVAVSWLGKLKTATQMASIILLLAQGVAMNLFVLLGYLCLYVASALTIWSMLIYLKAAWRDLTPL